MIRDNAQNFFNLICFYLDSHNNKCEFSKNFAVCMENKAQRVIIIIIDETILIVALK